VSILLNPYLIFDGNAKEAVSFYEKALGGKVVGIMTYGDLPADPDHPMPEEVKSRVMHAHLKVGDADLMFSDTYPGEPYQRGNAIQIAIRPQEPEVAESIFNALAEGGQVVLPLQKTDWSPMYGMVTDRYGITFQVNVTAGQ
jgi:PhnB protein